MNPLLDLRTRQLLPRWRDSATTAELGEIVAGGSAITVRDLARPDLIQQKVDDVAKYGGAAFAADLLASAIVAGDDLLAVDAARRLATSTQATDTLTNRVLLRATGHVAAERDELSVPSIADSKRQSQNRVHQAKSRLSRDYGNALAWADLAQAYAAVGMLDRAEQAIDRAIAFAPDDRFVLRSAARLFVHQKNPGKGLWLLRKAPLTILDPWLLASEISLSGFVGTPSRLIRHARTILDARGHADFDLAELRAALGTVEGIAGKIKVARKLFRAALQKPNDNVVAQAAWAHRYLGTAELRNAELNIPRSFEARARHFAEAGDWSAALTQMLKWHYDQPFSVSPVIHASYVAGVVLDEHSKATEIIELGMIANPHDWTLRNNLIFSLASLGKVKDAERAFHALPRETGYRDGVWLATAGLINFRSGRTSAGIDLYDAAIESFGSLQQANGRALAAFFRAREMVKAGVPESSDAVEQAEKFVKESTLAESDVLMRRLGEFAVASRLNTR